MTAIYSNAINWPVALVLVVAIVAWTVLILAAMGVKR